MRKVTLTLMSFALSCITAHAEDLSREIAKCAVVVGDLDRLECFDKTAKYFKLSGPQYQDAKVAGASKWQISRDKNPVDDSQRVFLMLTADAGRSRWGQPITFIARCQSKKTEAYINWNEYLGNDSSSVYREIKYVTIRIGKSNSERQEWDISTDKKATFAPSSARDLLRKMAKEETFLAQATPYNENPIVAIFDTKGMSAALEPLAETCGWNVN